MTSCCNASGLHLELNSFRKLRIKELPKQEESEKLHDCILYFEMDFNICLNVSLQLVATGDVRCGCRGREGEKERKKLGGKKGKENHLKREISDRGNHKTGLCSKKLSI